MPEDPPQHTHPDVNPSSPRRTPEAIPPTDALQRYRLLFEHNLAGVYCTAMNGQILDCNESMARMLGYDSREELLACRAQDLYFTPSDRQEFLTRLQSAGMLVNSELRLRRKDGTPIDILENVLLLPSKDGGSTVVQGTMVDITERIQAEEALRESEQRYRALTDDLRRLTQRMESVRERERARIARELHDELGQALTALNMDLHWLKGRPTRDSKAADARITSMCDLVNDTIQAIHRICSDLRPSVLDDFGLTAAIEWQAREFKERTGIDCQVSLPTVSPVLNAEQTTTVFRIFQESLTNIARHARATQTEVTLSVDAGVLVLRVADNGVGIAAEKLGGIQSQGLAGVRERALRWGGRVEISGSPNQGTTVTLHMPITLDSTESTT